MKDIRSLVNEITSKGASLYDLVKQEAEMRVIFFFSIIYNIKSNTLTEKGP